MIDQDDDMLGADRAIVRAARRAAELARQHGQKLILWKDGQIVRVDPDDLPPLPERAPHRRKDP